MFGAMEVDHLIPRSLRDEDLARAKHVHSLPQDWAIDDLANFVPSCRRCNRAKGDQIPPSAPAITLLIERARTLAPRVLEAAGRFDSETRVSRAIGIVLAAAESDSLGDAARRQLLDAVASLRESISDAVDADDIDEIELHDGATLRRRPSGWRVSTEHEHLGAVVAMSELPRSPRRFINRELELARLDGLLATLATADGPAVALVRGMPGVGKSALGTLWARRNVDRFPGGVLYGDFSKRWRPGPVDPGDVLAEFLRDLGTADEAIPGSLRERRRLFHRMTASAPILVVLDNVEHAGQAYATLPTTPRSVAVITTSFRLEELAIEGADIVDVDPFERDACRELLARFVQDGRLEAESAVVDDLVNACGGLPLALAVCAGRLASTPTRAVSDLVDGIAQSPNQLAALSGPDRYGLTEIFDYAADDLGPDAELVYRRLGLHPGSDISASSAAALADCPLDAAHAALDIIVDAFLIEPRADGRFRFHDLVRAHALSRAERADGTADRREAVGRLVRWYCASARRADRAILGDRLRLSDGVGVETDVPIARPESPMDAFRWFDSEGSNLVAAIRSGVDHGLDEEAGMIAEALWPWYYSHRRFTEWIASNEMGIDVAERTGNVALQARFLSQLARARAELGEPGAEDLMADALDAARASSVPMLEASVVEFAGSCELRAGRPAVAIGLFEQARGLFQSCGGLRGVGIQDYHLGWAHVLADQPADALSHLERAIDALTPMGDDITIARAHLRRGEALSALRSWSGARMAFELAVATLLPLQVRFELAQCHEGLAAVHEALHDARLARRHRQDAYRLYKELNHPRADALLGHLGAD